MPYRHVPPDSLPVDVVVATMTANGTRVPGGYVMPAGGHITFTCRHNGTSPEVIFWAIDVVNSTIPKQDTAAINLQGTPGLSTSVKSVTDNPVSVTVSNLQLANNGSTVKCEVKREGSPAVILVEGKADHTMPYLHAITIQACIKEMHATMFTKILAWFQCR